MEKEIPPADVMIFIAIVDDIESLEFLNEVNIGNWLNHMDISVKDLTYCITRMVVEYEDGWEPNPRNPKHMQTIVRWALKWLQDPMACSKLLLVSTNSKLHCSTSQFQVPLLQNPKRPYSKFRVPIPSSVDPGCRIPST